MLGHLRTMHLFSSIVATFLGLALSLLVNNELSIWDKLPANDKFWTVFASIYAAVAVIAGWGYAVSRVRVFGWIHALLMLGVAGLCAVYGFSTLGDRSITGGRGPDANPVAGIIYGFALLGVIVAVVTAVCGIGVVRHVLRKHTDERPVA
jgi:hypothetical protein